MLYIVALIFGVVAIYTMLKSENTENDIITRIWGFILSIIFVVMTIYFVKLGIEDYKPKYSSEPVYYYNNY